MAALLLAAPLMAPSAHATTTSITTSLSSPPGSPNKAKTSFSFRPWVSGDGRYVAFDSDSANLVPGDTNRVRDVFVHDRENGTLERISLGTGGKQANGDSQRPTVTADGRLVAFWSAADNLVDTDTNDVTDCFVHDRQTHETFRVDLGPDNSQANGECARPVISGDGKLVAFESAATNLEKPNVLNKSTDTNKVRDIFVRDLEAGTTRRISLSTDGKQAMGESVRPSFSANGRFVAFQSEGALQPDDTNKKTDVYLHDLDSNETTRVSIGPGGVEGNSGSFSPSLSADGRLLAYWSNASNFVPGDTNKTGDVFVFDRTDGSTTRISNGPGDAQGDGMSSDPSMSPDGRYVAYWSGASNLVSDDTNGKRDIFLFDRDNSTTVRVSVADDGTQGDGDSFSPNINAGGGLIAFDSAATTLVPDDHKTKGSDIFLHLEDSAGTSAAAPDNATPPPTNKPAGPKDQPPSDQSASQGQQPPADSSGSKDQPPPADSSGSKDQPPPADSSGSKDQPPPADSSGSKDQPPPDQSAPSNQPPPDNAPSDKAPADNAPSDKAKADGPQADSGKADTGRADAGKSDGRKAGPGQAKHGRR